MNESPRFSGCSSGQADGLYGVAGFLTRQLIVGGSVSVGFALLVSLSVGFAVLFGVLLMVVNAAWLNRRMMATDGLDVEAGQRALYSGAALRFGGLLLGLLVAGIMGLHLLYVALGMFVAQAVVFFTALRGFGKERR
jgi:hypothetical protein